MKDLTAKEKAKELVDMYIPQIQMADKFAMLLDSEWLYFAKQCALIAVDVILNDVGAKDWSGDIACEGRNYWQEVKSEIEKLI